jgi:hypothetical protein
MKREVSNSLREVIAAHGRIVLKVPRRCDELLPTWEGESQWKSVKMAISVPGGLESLAKRIADEMSIPVGASLFGVELWALGNALVSPGDRGNDNWSHIQFPDVPALAGYVFIREDGAPPDTHYELIGHPKEHVWFPSDTELELLLRGPLAKNLASLTGDIVRVRSLRIEFSEVDEHIPRDFPGARPEDDDLAPITRYTGLRWLLVSAGEGLTDACLAPLRTLNGLERLQLVGAGFTDVGLGLISQLPITRLALAATNVKGPGLVLLRQLEWLDLGFHDGIEEEWIRQLASLKNLRLLNLYGTRHSADTLRALRRALPDCEIISPQKG